MKISKELKVGLLALTSILLIYWGFSYLKGKNVLNSHFKIKSIYKNVGGLAISSPVTINGLVIGKVQSIKIQSNGELAVIMQIDNEDVQISKNAIAEIKDSGLIGGREISILNDFSSKEYVQTGEELKGEIKAGLVDGLVSELKPLEAKIVSLVDNANKLIASVNATLDARTQDNLKKSIASLETTLSNANKVMLNVNQLVDSNENKLSSMIDNFDKTSKNLDQMTGKLNQADLKGTVSKLESTLEQFNKVMVGINSGTGTMGKLVKDDKLYNNFAKASKELELLLQDLRLNPTRYVNVSLFGKKNKPYLAPVEEQSNKENK